MELQSLKTQVSRDISDNSNASQFRDLPVTLEQHRVMLVELRKSLPETREGTAGYWYNMKNIATKADPSLSSSVDRVILKIDNYYDWSDDNPGNQSSAQAFLQWQSDYRSSGAIAYEEATVAFTKDALQSVSGTNSHRRTLKSGEYQLNQLGQDKDHWFLTEARPQNSVGIS